MRPRTLRRRGRFYHRKRNRWRLNLALALIGVALAGFVAVNMRAGPPLPGPADVMAKRFAAPAPTTHAPALIAPAELGSTKLASTASAPVSAPPLRPGRPNALVAGPAPDANRRGFDGAGARLGVPTVRDVNVMEPAPVPRPLAQRSPTPPEGCKTCGDDVPF
jgi:hypothetical protein